MPLKSLSLLMLCLFGVISVSLGQSPVKPNVLLLVVDDLNDYVGYLDGHQQSVTPNIDKLAQRGTRFTNAYSNGVICVPSRTSFMTGKDPYYTQILDNKGRYTTDRVFRNLFQPTYGNETVFTLPEILKDSGGYYTMGIYKLYHGLYGQGYDNDFDTTVSDPCERSKSWNDFYDFDKYCNTTPICPDDGLGVFDMGPEPNSNEDNMPDVLAADSAIQFIENWATDPGQYCNRPFFLACGFWKPHLPFIAPERFFPNFYNSEYYQNPLELPYNLPNNAWPENGIVMPPQPEAGDWTDWDSLGAIAQYFSFDRRGHDAVIGMTDTISPTPPIGPGLTLQDRKDAFAQTLRANAIAAYLACVRYSDHQIGRVLDALDAQPGLAENTIIVLMSDHGYSLGQKKHWGKQGLWDTDIHVPLIIVDPQRSGGKACERAVSLLDVFPTIMSLTGVDAPTFPDGSPYLDGEDLSPLLDQPGRSWERPVVSSLIAPDNAPDGSCFPHYSIRNERWHYIRYQTDGDPSCDASASSFEEELYEIGRYREIDPNEWDNLADISAYDNIKDYLSQWLPDGAFYNTRPEHVEISYTGTDCSVSPTEPAYLTSRWLDANGVPQPLPAGSILNWTSDGWSGVITTDTIDLYLMIDPTLVDDKNSIRVQLKVTSGGAEVRWAERVVHIDNPSASSLDFSLSHAGSGLVEVIALEETIQATKGIWDYGDGQVLEWLPHLGIPPVHQYTASGTYTVRRTLEYGNEDDPSCTLSTTKDVVLTSSDFPAASCLRPLPPILEGRSADRLALSATPVEAASGYKFFYKPADNAGGGYLQSSDILPEVLVTGLLKGELYEVRVAAACGSLNSDTSAPAYYATKDCPKPRRIRVEDVSSDGATVLWKAGQESGDAAGLLVKRLSGGSMRFRVETDSLELTGLDGSTDYQVKVITLCEQIGPGVELRSEPTSAIDFSTSAFLTGKQTAESVDFALSPNPASDFLTLHNLSEQATVFAVYSLNGGLQLSATTLGARGSSNLDLRSWHSGQYMVEFRSEEGSILDQRFFILER